MSAWDYLPGSSLINLGNGDPSDTRQQQRQQANDPQFQAQQKANQDADPRLGGKYPYTSGDTDPDWNKKYRAGVDDTAWSHVVQPSAYEYGQKIGGAQEEEDRYKGLAAAADQRSGAQMNLGMYNADRGLEMGSRGNQDYALGQYQNMIQGNGPSIAEQQMRRGIALSNAQQQSIAAGARGGGAGLAAAQAAGANAAANASGNVIGQMGSVRAQEQLGALQGYAGLATQQRAGDLQRQGLSEQQAYQQAMIEQQQHQLNDARNMSYEQMRQKVFEDQDVNRQAGEAANAGAFFNTQQNDTANRQIDQSVTNAEISGGIAAGAALLSAASDVRKKSDIGDGRAAVQQQMAAMPPYRFRYTDPTIAGAGPGQRLGVMAQDMERGPYGHQLVKNTPEGKKIDGPGGLSLALASGADHEQRLRQLEQRSDVAPGMPLYGQAPPSRYLPPEARAAMARDMTTRNILGSTQLAGQNEQRRQSGLAAAAAEAEAQRSYAGLAQQAAVARGYR